MSRVALKPLLTPHLIKGRIFTLDAIHTQRTLCAQIHRREGDYLLIAKDNQPTLHEDIADLFEDRSPDRRRWKQAETWDKAHGRLEHRQITCSPDLGDWFAQDWEGIEQVFRLERTAVLATWYIRLQNRQLRLLLFSICLSSETREREKQGCSSRYSR